MELLSAQSFSTATIAAALRVTPQAVSKRADKAGWEKEFHRTQGGGILWKFTSLDTDTKEAVAIAAIASQHMSQNVDPVQAEAHNKFIELRWADFLKKPDSIKDRAAYRHGLLFEAWQLHIQGLTLTKAFSIVARQHGVSEGNLRNWYFGTRNKRGVRGIDPKDWLPFLADNYRGRVKNATCTEKAWSYFLKDYMRREEPSFSLCYRRLCRIAAVQGWQVPSEQTLRRRLKKEVCFVELQCSRKGDLSFSYPKMERDHSVFHAGQAVSGDALNFDKLQVYDEITGEVFTPRVWFFQDIYSGKILAYDADKSENSDMFRRAFYKLTDICVPEWMTIDNTHAASNKVMTGQMPRNRFKTLATDPVGLLQYFGIRAPHRTNPDKDIAQSGSNPIERAFGIGGLHERMKTWPAFIGRGFNAKNPLTFSEFLTELAHVVAEYNAETGRRSPICKGRSFDETFAESYSKSTIRKADPSLRRMLLFSQEVAKVAKDGTVKINAGQGKTKHRFYSESLHAYSGELVSVMFNPDNISSTVNIFSIGGNHLCDAEPMLAVAFNSTTDAREHAKHKIRRNKAIKKSVAAKCAMDDLEFKMLNNAVAPATIPAPGRETTLISPKQTNALFANETKVSPEQRAACMGNLFKNLATFNSESDSITAEQA